MGLLRLIDCLYQVKRLFGPSEPSAGRMDIRGLVTFGLTSRLWNSGFLF